jgi:hypothetical protein
MERDSDESRKGYPHPGRVVTLGAGPLRVLSECSQELAVALGTTCWPS